MTKHGGKREGAGRPAGAVTKKTREIAEQAIQEGVTPLEYMLNVLRDETAEAKDRMWAAEKAAPYVHPKLANIEHQGTMTHEAGDSIQSLMERIATNGKRITDAG